MKFEILCGIARNCKWLLPVNILDPSDDILCPIQHHSSTAKHSDVESKQQKRYALRVPGLKALKLAEPVNDRQVNWNMAEKNFLN